MCSSDLDLEAFEKLVDIAVRCDRVLDATSRLRRPLAATQKRNAQLENEIAAADALKEELQAQVDAADQRAKDLRKELADRKAAMLPDATAMYHHQQHHDALLATFQECLATATANRDSSNTLAGRFARAWQSRGLDTAHGLLQGAAALLPSIDLAMSTGQLGLHPDDPEGECPPWALSSYIDRPRDRAPNPELEDSEEEEVEEPSVPGKGKERAI